MRLSQFIYDAKEKIIAESLAHAVRIPAMKGASTAILHNHLPLILDAICRDLKQAQSRTQSIQKSLGNAQNSPSETAAQTHGTYRARSGLSIEQLIAEYRVMRSCVLRLWADTCEPDQHISGDTLRFNEAIDQALAESVAFFTIEVSRWRGIFLSVLGHDLRSPVNTVLLSAELLKQRTSGDTQKLADLLVRSGRRLTTLLDSLLDYNKSSLGVGMELHLKPVDLGPQCQEEVELLRLAFPKTRIVFTLCGDTRGSFDASRVREALANLIANAAQHSPPGTAVMVAVAGTGPVVELSTENVSPPIPPDEINALFDPLRRRSHAPRIPSPNLGLGLFIVREIARAHQGEVTASTSNGHIRFKVVLPKLVTATSSAD